MIIKEATSFVTVLVVAVGIASAIGTLYASGLRLWASGETDTQGEHLSRRVMSAVCFAACVAIVLFALWLMIPVFH